MNEVNTSSLIEQLIEITSKIIARHQESGPRSPLSPRQVAELNFRITNARGKHAEGMRYRRMMEQAWAERDRFLFSDDASESIHLKVNELCETLREMYKDNQNELKKWGL